MVRVFSLTVPGQARANLRDSRAGRDWRRQDFAVASMGEDDPVIYVRLIDHLAGRLIQRCRVLQTVVGRLSQEVQRLRGASRAPRMSLRASQQFRRRRHHFWPPGRFYAQTYPDQLRFIPVSAAAPFGRDIAMAQIIGGRRPIADAFSRFFLETVCTVGPNEPKASSCVVLVCRRSLRLSNLRRSRPS
jgi:hypothetical protein